jgi:sterol desaturase/sphingolipid hydroxylase (fatty acid hydroxylase superfamily)
MLNLDTHDLLVVISTPIYLGFILFEVLLGQSSGRKWYTWKNTLQNGYLMVLNGGFDVLIRGFYLVILSTCWQYRFFNIQNQIVYWTLLLIGVDFMFYWLHRLEHSVRLFWAVHVTHHSSELFNFTVGFRSSVLQPLYRFVFFIPLALLGFQAIDIVIVFSACQIWGILVHTELVDRLGWIEKILVTPSHHRVHHASNPLYLDKNMGMFLIVWDKLFGTFQEELPANNYQPIKFGLTSPKNLEMPIAIITHEWKDIIEDCKMEVGFKEKLQYLIGPPGYSHDGSRLTSIQMRARESEILSSITYDGISEVGDYKPSF